MWNAYVFLVNMGVYLVSYDENQNSFKIKIENGMGLKIGNLNMKNTYSVIKFTKIYNILDSKI